MQNVFDRQGFTLIELVVVIVIIGIIATVSVRQMIGSIDDARFEQTRREMEHLGYAITGNPDLYTDGARSDFGYVGDIGALPPTLNALLQNPGGYTSWDGPYVDADGALTDAWGSAYVLNALTIRSTGSGNPIDHPVAASSAELLQNSVSGFVSDAGRRAPGSVYRDSVTVILRCPNGSGGIASTVVAPSADGSFTFSNVPVGNHHLLVVYAPVADTVAFTVCVPPGSEVKLDLALPADLW